MKNSMKQVSALIPPEFKTLKYSLGWCAKSVDMLANKLSCIGFDSDPFMLEQIFRLNNSDILFDSSILSALIGACSFIYIDIDDSGYPRLECIEGYNATGTIDSSTRLLREGYAVIERDEGGQPAVEAYFLPYRTEYYRYGEHEPFDVFEHSSPYPLLVPVVNRPGGGRDFGHSRISRACMDIVQSALRTMLRTEVAAEFYSVPQKYIVGLSQDAEFDNRKATLSSFMRFSKDEDGDHPTLGQFQQQSMAPHLEYMREIASEFAGETDLTLDDLGFNTGNPMSYEAIRAAHAPLRAVARKAQKTFGVSFLNAGYLAACIRDNYAYQRSAFADCRLLWYPVDEPDAASLGVIGDAILKVNQASEGYLGERNIMLMTGMESDNG